VNIQAGQCGNQMKINDARSTTTRDNDAQLGHSDAQLGHSNVLSQEAPGGW
jgi:hypothetical protein